MEGGVGTVLQHRWIDLDGAVGVAQKGQWESHKRESPVAGEQA